MYINTSNATSVFFFAMFLGFSSLFPMTFEHRYKNMLTLQKTGFFLEKSVEGNFANFRYQINIQAYPPSGSRCHIATIKRKMSKTPSTSNIIHYSPPADSHHSFFGRTKILNFGRAHRINVWYIYLHDFRWFLWDHCRKIYLGILGVCQNPATVWKQCNSFLWKGIRFLTFAESTGFPVAQVFLSIHWFIYLHLVGWKRDQCRYKNRWTVMVRGANNIPP